MIHMGKTGITGGGADETRTRDLGRDRPAFPYNLIRPLQSRVDTVLTEPLKMAQLYWCGSNA